MYKHILIATDGSEPSQRAVRQGMELAREQNAKVTLLTATPPLHPLAIEPRRLVDEDDYRKVTGRAANERLQEGAAYAKSLGVDAELAHVYVDHPADAIVERARRGECDLVVMGTRGHTGLQRAILGSQAQEVICKSTVPVLVCH
jgi:nucleotide-binding universal stress UspA family protein